MDATLEAPVQKGLKARTEASRVVPMPHAAKSQFNLYKNTRFSEEPTL